MKESLYVVGVGTVIGVCVCLAYLVIDGIIRGMKILKYRYKEKHRYDKPPIAKCYCKDCKFRIDGICTNLANIYTANEFFCCLAQRKEVYDEQEKA